MSGQEALGAEGLIQCKGEVAGSFLTIIYDSGATHAFVSLACAEQLNMGVTPLMYELVVSTPGGETLVANSACTPCSLVIEGRPFLANLICLPLRDLDVILGMDWLSRHHILLYCA